MRWLGAIVALGLASTVGAVDLVQVENVRMWPAPDHTRVVFDTSGPVEHTVFVLNNPDRVVVDLRGARLGREVPEPSAEDPLLARVRSAVRERRDLRVVLDLKQAARPKSFVLKPNQKYGHRLVIDLQRIDSDGTPRIVKSVPQPSPRLREVVIAIDAGHGGEDPGASGPGGTLEKDVVFAVAKQLEALLERERGMRPVLIRTADYYVGLRKRMQIAREQRADLFVSIHADAFRDPRVRGSSVYTLSRNGASSEAARWLADQENAADLVGGVSLDDKDDVLASVLLDLSQTATLGASVGVGEKVLHELKRLGKTHKKSVQQAGFAVLKSPDVPSILVETAFISNPQEEGKLRDPRHQRALAAAILRGVRHYMYEHAPPGTLLATRRHVIEEGDTLSEIAQRYQISTDSLRVANRLSGDAIRAGQILRIPPGYGS